MESDISQETKEEKRIRTEKRKEGLLFPKEKWDELIHWKPVSNISIDEIYKDLPEVKKFHYNYVSLWELRTKTKER